MKGYLHDYVMLWCFRYMFEMVYRRCWDVLLCRRCYYYCYATAAMEVHHNIHSVKSTVTSWKCDVMCRHHLHIHITTTTTIPTSPASKTEYYMKNASRIIDSLRFVQSTRMIIEFVVCVWVRDFVAYMMYNNKYTYKIKKIRIYINEREYDEWKNV